MKSRVGSAEQSNTSILYADKLILKFFRRIQPGENPDVEIGRFLTEVAHFPAVAPFLGEISITPASGNRTTVAMLQGLVANRGRWMGVVPKTTRQFLCPCSCTSLSPAIISTQFHKSE